MLIPSEMAFVAVCAMLVAVGFFIAPNRSHFLLAAAVMTIAWQGGVWVEYFKMDFTLTYFIFGVLFVWNFINPQRHSQLRGPFPLPLYFWLCVTVFCALGVMPAIEKYAALSGVARAVIDVMICFAVLKSLRSPRDIQFFVGALMAAMIFQGALAAIQFKFPFFKIGVIDDSQSWMWWRTKGTFFHANEMGMYSLLMIPVTARVFFNSLLNGDRKWAGFSGITLMIGCLALFTTANRGSWVGCFVGTVCMLGYDFYSRGMKLKKVLLGLSVPATILLMIFAFKYGENLVDRLFYSNAEGMLEGRLEYQTESLNIIKAHSILGVGYGNYLNHVRSYFVHNLYLLVAAEIGIPGLVFLLGFLFAFFLLIIKGMRSKVFYVSNLSRGCFAILIGFAISSLPGPDFWISHPVQMYFWMLVILQVALLRLDRRVMDQVKLQKQRARKQAAPQMPAANGLAAVPIANANIRNKSSLADIKIGQFYNQH